jgi:RecA/RadA recombinase
MMADTLRPPIVPPTPEGVPPEMRALRRWAPWRAEWNEKKKKWTKIPHKAARPEFGLSNKSAVGWVTFDEAMTVYEANRDKFAGVGYLMTDPHGIIGTDLDNCRDPATGKLDDWAAEVVEQLGTYTEVSPSGTGVHAMSLGSVPEDWTNHERGIEVYGGNEARFLCVTGQRLEGSPTYLKPAPVALEYLAHQYRRAKTKAEVEDLHLPGLLPVDLLPGLDELDLPPHAANFLNDGPGPGDRSRQLFAAAIALSQAGLAPDEVLSVLEANPHAMEVALDHRRQDYDKALRYLWKQCQEGKARGEQLKEEGYEAFDMLDVPTDPDEDDEPVAAPLTPSTDPSDPASVDDFAVLPEDDTEAPAKPERKTKFPMLSVGKFLKRKPMSWKIRGILPNAALAVIFGASAAGKTFFALDMVAALARGIEWRGKRVTKGRGVYIVAEGTEGFRNRVEAYCNHHGIDPAALDIIVMPAAPQMMDKKEVVELIKDLQTLGPLDFVVIDTYARVLVGGNENDAADAGVMVDHCARIHKHTGALVILIHHSGKDPSNGMRGSSVLKAAADVVIEVVRTKEYREAAIDKMKDGDDTGKFRFKLPIVELGEDEEGDPITSCVVEHVDAPEGGDKATGEGLRGMPLTVFTAVADALELAGEITYAEAIDLCVPLAPEAEEGKKDRRRDVVIRAITTLTDKGHLKMDGPNVTLANL